MNTKTLDLQQISALLKDPTLVPFLLIWITHGIGGFGITFVLPNVIYDLGMTDTAISQLMTMPAYTAVFAILLTLGGLTHKGCLSPWVAGLILEIAQIICYILLITVDNAVAKYVFVCIATAATSSFFPILWPGKRRSNKVPRINTELTGTISRAHQSGKRNDERRDGYRHDKREWTL